MISINHSIFMNEMKKMIVGAQNGQYIIPAFNFDNFDVLEGIIDGALKSKSPIILQITQPALEFLGVDNVIQYTKFRFLDENIRAVLHVDHVDNIDFFVKCLKHGVRSLMFDASEKKLQENIQLTNQVLALKSQYDFFLESEVGQIGCISDVNEVIEFSRKCKVDLLGVSVGNKHGVRKKKLFLDKDRLYEILKIVDKPIVLHGCSGVLEEELSKIRDTNVCKVNFETQLRLIFRDTIKNYMDNNKDDIKPRNYMKMVRSNISQAVANKCKILGSIDQY